MARDYVRKNNRHSSRRDKEGGRNWRWPLAGILIALFAVGIFYLKEQSDKLATTQGDEGGSIIQQTMKQNTPETTVAPRTSSTAKKPAANATSRQQTETPASSPPQPKFDFYTMLPKGQMAGPSNKTNTATPAPAPSSPTAATPLSAEKPVTAPITSQPIANAAPASTTPTGSTTESEHPSQKQLEQSAQTDTSDLIAVEIQKLGADKDSKNETDSNTTKTSAHYIVQLGVFKNYNDADQLKAQLVLQGFDVTIKNFKKQSTLYRVYMGPYPSLGAAKKQQHLLEVNQIKSKIAKE